MSKAARFERRGSLTRRAALASVATALLLLVVKLYATAETGSVSMLASLADTGLDLIAALVTLIGVKVAAEPADHDHRFGHGKAEAVAALMQTMLIGFSAVGIGWRAITRIMEPVAPSEPELGISVSIFAILVTFALVAYQKAIVRRTESIAIETDQVHYQSDLALNLSVIVALVLDGILGIRGVDAIFGFLIAVWLAWNGYKAAHRAIDVLMDREWSEGRRREIQDIVVGLEGVEGIHDLRTRRSGAHDFIQFHIWVDPDMTVRAAHTIVDRVEVAIEQSFPGTEVLVHVDPRGHIDTPTPLAPPEDAQFAD